MFSSSAAHDESDAIHSRLTSSSQTFNVSEVTVSGDGLKLAPVGKTTTFTVHSASINANDVSVKVAGTLIQYSVLNPQRSGARLSSSLLGIIPIRSVNCKFVFRCFFVLFNIFLPLEFYRRSDILMGGPFAKFQYILTMPLVKMCLLNSFTRSTAQQDQIRKTNQNVTGFSVFSHVIMNRTVISYIAEIYDHILWYLFNSFF